MSRTMEVGAQKESQGLPENEKQMKTKKKTQRKTQQRKVLGAGQKKIHVFFFWVKTSLAEGRTFSQKHGSCPFWVFSVFQVYQVFQEF